MPRRRLNPTPFIWLIGVLLLAAGFYASWVKIWGDQNWLSRAGGLVTFIAGWNVLVTDVLGRALDEQAAEGIAFLRATGPTPKNLDQIYQRFGDTLKRQIKIRELSLLALGTLVWALGDLIQFVPR